MPKRFFQQPSISQKSEISLDASFRQDGFVRSLALMIVDKLVSRRFDNQVVTEALLKKLNQHFPDSVPQAAHANAKETLELMTSTPQKASRTALELTWVLRQMMVDTMCQTPIQYLPAFYQQGDIVKPSELRQPGTTLDKSGLMALAKLLDITVVVHQTEKNQQLPATQKYGQSEVVYHIDEEEGRYTPRVKNKEVFRPLNSITNVKKALVTDDLQDENLQKQVESLVERIQTANKENTNWLENMLEEGSLSYVDLLGLYMSNADLITWQREFVESATVLNTLLVNVAANMISFGITSREDLFEREVFEAQPLSSPTMV